MNKEEWFALFDENRQDIQNLIYKFHPYYSDFNEEDYPITAGAAEAVCEVFRTKIAKKKIAPDLNIRSLMYLVGVLNSVWLGMPESISVHSEPGFDILCTLCSEYEQE